ncbi:hypothetical protein EV174_000071 [Coemansia sp. RSA 2320]|nr:hypothetical protein EV174_000071 [Coemansia sp. RSA 2320]
MGETNSTAYEDVFAELLRPLDPSLGRLVDVESVHAAVQQWSIAMQASISGESPAILMDLLDRYISRLRELLPAIIDHIDSDNLRTRSGMYLQGEHLREFYRAVCEAASIGEWLLQRRFCLLPVLFPALVNDTRLQPILRQAIKMSRVCENMYCLVQSAPEFSLALNDMATEYEEVVNAKYACYGDIVAQDGLAWKAVGLPVEYALLARVKQWMETASSLCLSRIAHSHERRAKSSSAYNDKALSADSLLQCSIQVLHSAALSATMCGDSFNNVAPHVMYIASECTLWTCNKFKYPSTCHGDSAAWRICGKPGVQFCQGKQLSNRAMRLLAACESILKILSYAKTILVSSSKSSIFDLDIRIDHAEHVSAALETLAASVVELSWSLAEILSAFRSDGQIANPSGTMILFAEFVAKFAKRVAEFGNGRHATTDTHLRLHQIQTCVRKLASHMANS